MALRKKKISTRASRKNKSSAKSKARAKTALVSRTRSKKNESPAKEPRRKAGNSERRPAIGATRVGDADPKSNVEVTITLRGPKLPDVGALAARAASPRAIQTRYGASRQDAAKVSQVLRKFGLTIEQVSLGTRSMIVSGTVAQMEAAFHPGLGMYKSKGQDEFRDREGEYAVPDSLRKIVTAVLGFGERRVAQRKPAKARAGIARRLRAFEPADIESHYRFPPGDAEGQKIAIAEFGGGYFASDLADYCRKFNRPVPTVKTVSINMPVRNLSQIKRLRKGKNDEIDYTGEVMMDVQVVAGLCPAAEISVYFAKDNQKGWVDLLNRVICDKPVALSISWGAAEDSGDWSKAALNAINERLQLAALCGITVCGASGDDGSGDMQPNKRAHVDFPSSSPYVLSVGGTMITRKSGKLTERVWRVGQGRRIRSVGGATGGGVSTVFGRPSWQGVRIATVNKRKFDGRVVPDISALAGPPMFELIFLGSKTVGGGTSASTPLLAALIARVNALLPRSKRQRYLTPLLYRAAPHGLPMGRVVCHDVTVGHNISNPNPGVGYHATVGFDAASGWGTPIGAALLSALT